MKKIIITEQQLEKILEKAVTANEMVDQEWLDNNPDYYITKMVSNMKKSNRGDEVDVEKSENMKNVIDDAKNLTINDITFQTTDKYDHFFLSPIITNNKYLTDILRSFFLIKDEKKFGLGNRIHTQALPIELQKLGLGYKLYLAVIKHLGYITSGSNNGMLSPKAANVYLHLLKEPNLYHVIDLKLNATLLIWKDNPDLKNIILHVREYEKKHNLKFNYDERLNEKNFN